MLKRMFKLGAVVGLLLAAATGFTACSDSNGGGGKELTLEEYFQELQTVNDSFTEESDAVGEELGNLDDIAQIRETFAKLPALLKDFVDELDGLNPPDEAQDAHDEAVEAGRAFVDEIDGVVDDINDVDLIEDLGALVEGDAVTEANDRFSETCRALQEIAEDNEIDVNLDCEEE